MKDKGRVVTDTAERKAESDNRGTYFYDTWMESAGVPIHRGHFVSDLRTIEVGYWEERECNAAFIQLIGQQGVSEGRVIEIPPGETVKSYKMAIDDVVYVISGTGSTRLWSDESSSSSGHVFEWHDRALFQIPANHYREFSNLHPTQPARLLHYSYMPVAMSVIPDADFFFNNPFNPELKMDEVASNFGDAKEVYNSVQGRSYWTGNFFPDMAAWDKLRDHGGRGGGGSVVKIRFAGSQMGTHMSVFPNGVYKKAHRHGPGRLIVIPSGEGYSLLWKEGGEKVVIPWQQDSVFTPPEGWFHQHFNLGANPARYLALGPLPQFGGHEEDISTREIAYVREDRWIREYFEEQLAKVGQTTLMPEEAYTNPSYSFKRRA